MTISCIYSIKNNRNGKLYVGSTKDFQFRKKRHLRELRKGTHHNQHLQRAFDKDPDSFTFEIIEEVEDSPDIRFLREEYYMITLSPQYNIGGVGGGDNFSNHPDKEILRERLAAGLSAWRKSLSEEEQQIICNNFTGSNNPNYGNRWSDEQKNAMSERMKTRHKHDPSYGEMSSERMKNYWANMTSEEYDAVVLHMSESRKGEGNSFFGKEHTHESKEKIREAHISRIREYKEAGEYYDKIRQARKISVDGVVFDSVSIAAAELGIHQATLAYQAKSKSFTNVEYLDDPRTQQGRTAMTIEVISPNGETFIGTPQEVSDVTGIAVTTIHSSSKKKTPPSRGKLVGWTIKRLDSHD